MNETAPEAEERTRLIPENPEELGRFLHVNIKLLYRIANHPEEFYKVFRIPKRNGKFRTIEAPRGILKLTQRRILREILSPMELHPAATAFRPGRSIKDNAGHHVGQPVILKLDIKDFFPSLHITQVYPLFQSAGYPRNVATLLARLCCLEHRLPQGAPTSPCLSNLILYPVDVAFTEWAANNQCRYTRYADDITLSGELEHSTIQAGITMAGRLLHPLGLHLNREKIQIQRQGNRQTVTGLTINRTVNIPRRKQRELRQIMYYIDKFGWSDCQRHCNLDFRQLLGYVNFAASITDNPEIHRWRDTLLRLSGSGNCSPPVF